MRERRIFLDTSGVFAWINARDPHHELMLSLAGQPMPKSDFPDGNDNCWIRLRFP